MTADCGGCRGEGSHRRWCPEVVGHEAARLGRLAEEAESLGDRIGSNDPSAANRLYEMAEDLTLAAREPADEWKETHA